MMKKNDILFPVTTDLKRNKIGRERSFWESVCYFSYSILLQNSTEVLVLGLISSFVFSHMISM
jgi:hypothetical protein